MLFYFVACVHDVQNVAYHKDWMLENLFKTVFCDK